MRRLTPLFVSHGPPTIVIDAVPTRAFLRDLGAAVGRPRAILCVSAHWETREVAVSGTPAPQTIHDFYGFPEALYGLRYPAPGAPEVAQTAAKLLGDAGIDCALDPRRGLDHGAWQPAMLMYPEADVPIAQLSVQQGRDAAHHLALGRALAPLTETGVLVLGSGNATHNLGERSPRDAPPVSWARAFHDWLVGTVEAGDEAALLAWESVAPEARRNHPTPDHYLPLVVAFGAAGPGARGRLLHDAFLYATLSMAAFAFEPA